MRDSAGQIDRTIRKISNNVHPPMGRLLKDLEGPRKPFSDRVATDEKAPQTGSLRFGALSYPSSTEMWKKKRHDTNAVWIEAGLETKCISCELGGANDM
jgi:hypothetical protein